ncbi:glucosamine inositolphosphorylceramide transferase family protein [Leptolyngbya ohadii]|uniref:glucosamine inositolphosphorylceramide transferase family protein n=1 Tax=Leptolyngbya ohadii TaxID=1962290 RepID=UPI0019D41549|nr:hypothetical protein [Leptolyngbya ohadii]
MKQFIKRFIRKSESWSIGVYEANDLLVLKPPAQARNPVLTARNVTDISAEFVADPFMLRKDDRWYMFFEALNAIDGLGKIALASSLDGFHWTYHQIVLDEPFHLSYPYVFHWNNEYYMVPETYQINEARLYKADPFPDRWVFEKTLLKGMDHVDSSLIRSNHFWWLFSSTTSNDVLRLYYAEDLLGEWQEHPDSPIIEGNARFARPAGRLLELGQRLIRFAQDDQSIYGRQVYAFEITSLTPTHYAERQMFEGEPMLSASDSGWNAVGMHHVDLHPIDSDRWLACVDAKGKPSWHFRPLRN